MHGINKSFLKRYVRFLLSVIILFGSNDFVYSQMVNIEIHTNNTKNEFCPPPQGALPLSNCNEFNITHSENRIKIYPTASFPPNGKVNVYLECSNVKIPLGESLYLIDTIYFSQSQSNACYYLVETFDALGNIVGRDSAQPLNLSVVYKTELQNEIVFLKWNSPCFNKNTEYFVYKFHIDRTGTKSIYGKDIVVDTNEKIRCWNTFFYDTIPLNKKDSVGYLVTGQCGNYRFNESEFSTPLLYVTGGNPSLTLCAKVDDQTNQNALYWNYTGDFATFKEYRVYEKCSTANTKTLLASIQDFNQMYYKPTGSLGTGCYYFVEAIDAFNSNIPADSIRTISLSVRNENNTNKYALLDWTKACFCPYYNYEISRKISSNGAWESVATLQNQFSYKDTLPPICKDTVFYKVEEINSSCISVSNVAGALFEDKITPLPPVFDSVSVNSQQQIQLGWTPSLSPDVEGYLVYKYPFLSSDSDTVWGNMTTFFIDNVDATQVWLYEMAAFDRCKNTSILTENQKQNNMVLTLNREECSRDIQLSWNAYINMLPGLAGYEIYIKTASDFQWVETLPNSQLSYAYKVPENIDDISFLVRAVSTNGKTSSSNIQNIAFGAANLPSYIYLKAASVNPANQAEIEFTADMRKPFSQFEILRSENGNTFAQVGNVNTESGKSDYSFLDRNAKVEKNPYFYQIRVNDACREQSKTSNVAKTICLKVSSPTEKENDLDWNVYEGWGSVASYSVYRFSESSPDKVLVAELSGSATSYQDFLLDNSAFEKYTYFVTAAEGDGNPYGIHAKANSSRAWSVGEGQIYIPNAFTPNGSRNNIFIPVCKFVEHENYVFTIYSRFSGLKVFETTNIDEGWTGRTSDGALYPVDAYVYKISGVYSTGQKFTKTGIVNLLE